MIVGGVVVRVVVGGSETVDGQVVGLVITGAMVGSVAVGCRTVDGVAIGNFTDAGVDGTTMVLVRETVGGVTDGEAVGCTTAVGVVVGRVDGVGIGVIVGGMVVSGLVDGAMIIGVDVYGGMNCKDVRVGGINFGARGALVPVASVMSEGEEMANRGGSVVGLAVELVGC